MESLPFQFQYGAIRCTLIDNVSIQFVKFQFQYGAIRCLNYFRIITGPTLFQFQYGAIRCLFPETVKAVAIFVSIPIWCD